MSYAKAEKILFGVIVMVVAIMLCAMYRQHKIDLRHKAQQEVRQYNKHIAFTRCMDLSDQVDTARRDIIDYQQQNHLIYDNDYITSLNYISFIRNKELTKCDEDLNKED